MALFGFLDSHYDLVFGRTNWQWGKKSIHILMLAVVYKGIAIPVFWLLLNKKGNSNSRERIALLKRFIAQFGKERIIKVLSDREFVGKKWFKWLKNQDIDFAIRIKKNAKVSNSRGQLVQVHTLFRTLKPGETLILFGQRTVDQVKVSLTALRLENGELLIVATSKPCLDAIDCYAKRWQIETLFSCLKSRGFNFEDTHITDRNRIKRLLVVAVIAFCWAHKIGEWQHQQKPIKIKKHGRLAKSLFRTGLDWICESCRKWLYGSENKEHFLFLALSLKPIN